MSLCSYQQDTVVESEEKNTHVACQKKERKKKSTCEKYSGYRENIGPLPCKLNRLFTHFWFIGVTLKQI